MPTEVSRATRGLAGRLAVESDPGPQSFGDLAPDPHHRVEGGHGVLEDQGHLRCPTPSRKALR